jgi:FAD/FMN-containing dehydrogenase
LLARAGRLAVGAAVVPIAARIRSSAPDLGVLQSRIRGTVVGAGSGSYDAARRLYSPRFDGIHPLAVVYCTSAGDVAHTVRWAKANNVRIAVRSGGHSYGGYSTRDAGVVIDVSRIAAVLVDDTHRTARIGAGARLIDIYGRLAQHGVTIPAGSCPSVGIGGLTLGGGFGVASRKFGLTCDSVRAATVVTAAGKALHCDSRNFPGLFWASRGGGGGSFGVVTAFTFATHPIGDVVTFRASWNWSDASHVLTAWQAWAPHAPDELFSLIDLVATSSGATVIGGAGQYFGTQSELDSLLQRLFAAGAQPTSLEVTKRSYLDAMLFWANCSDVSRCHLGDEVGRSTYLAKSDFFTSPLPAAGVAAILRAVEARAATPASGSLLFDAWGGAVARVSKTATAFVHRDALFSCQYIGSWDSAGDAGAEGAARSWLRNTYAAARPYASGFAYQNYIDPELPDSLHAYYGENLPRLRRIKRIHDPNNVFRFAQSIPPSPPA